MSYIDCRSSETFSLRFEIVVTLCLQASTASARSYGNMIPTVVCDQRGSFYGIGRFCSFCYQTRGVAVVVEGFGASTIRYGAKSHILRDRH